MNIQEVKEEISRVIGIYLWKDGSGYYRIPRERQRPVLLMGTPGVGKTAIMRQLAEEKGLALISYTISHHTHQSAIGLPIVTEQLFDGRPQRTTNYTTSEVVASVYEMMGKDGRREGILFLDEINTTSETLAPTMLQFLQYKTFGTHRVPDGWVIVTTDSPPEYDRAVRDFGMVTKDRVRELRVTVGFAVWRRYALERGIHGAVLAFLELEPEAFFFVCAGEAGKHLVTARGWEDLSDSLEAYETLRLDMGEAFTTSFLQDAEIAGKLYRHCLLYRKYAALYDIAGILGGREKADVARLKKTGFDEKLSFVALLSAAIGEYVRKWREEFRMQQGVFRILKEIRDAETAGQTVVTEALREAHFTAEQRLSWEQVAETLSPSQERQLVAVVTGFRHYETLSDAAEPKDAFDALRTAFVADEAARKQREAETGEALSRVLRFTAEGFGEGQELALFLTELNKSSAVLAFADETDHVDYARYNQLLLLRDRRETLKEGVMQFL